MNTRHWPVTMMAEQQAVKGPNYQGYVFIPLAAMLGSKIMQYLLKEMVGEWSC